MSNALPQEFRLINEIISGVALRRKRQCSPIDRSETKKNVCEPIFVLQSTDAEASLKTQSDVRQHVGEFLLDQLSLSQRSTELQSKDFRRFFLPTAWRLTVPTCIDERCEGRILQRPTLPNRCRNARCSNSRTGPENRSIDRRRICSEKRYFQTGNFRQKIRFGNVNVVHGDLSGNGGAQGEFALDLRRGETFHRAFENKTANLFVIALGPNDGDVSDR